MSLVILTSLGGSEYKEATYTWQNFTPYPTKLVSAALAAWFPEAEIKVLATPFAAEKNGELLNKLLPKHQRIPIEDGKTEEDSWELFQAVADAIPEGAEVIFDITHGFRSLPVVTLLALSYLRIAKNIKLKAVVYGAWQAGQTTTPIFDLTPFITLLDWAQAAKRFQDTGDARSLSIMLLRETAPVGKAMTALSDDLFASRGQAIGPSANKVMAEIKLLESSELGPNHRPLSLILDQIQASLSPLAHSEFSTDKNKEETKLALQAEYAQIVWFAERGHYVQALSLMSEWCKNVRSWYENGFVEMNYKHREMINKDLAEAHKKEGKRREELKRKKKAYDKTSRELEGIPEKLWELGWISGDIANARNDPMHFGFRKDPSSSQNLAKRVHKLIKQLPDAVRLLGLELKPPNTLKP